MIKSLQLTNLCAYHTNEVLGSNLDHTEKIS